MSLEARDFERLHRKVMPWPRKLLGLDYIRYVEWPTVYDMARVEQGLRLMDVGAGGRSLFPLALAWRNQTRVLAVDLADPLAWLRTAYEKLAARGFLAGSIETRTGVDARRTDFPEASMDRITCISVLEHIPDSGDSQSISEFGRLLAPGGRVVVSVPFAARPINEYKPSNVYERTLPEGEESLFFNRRYSFDCLQDRLVRPSGMKLIEERYIAEPTRQFLFELSPRRPHKDGALIWRRRQSILRRLGGCGRYSRRYLAVWTRQQAESEPDKVREAVLALAPA